MYAQVRPYVLTEEAERALRQGDAFKECAKDCPTMVVIPAGEFMMGSPASERGRYAIEGPRHKVTIARPFAVSKLDVTFADWDACVAVGGCPKEYPANDFGWGRGEWPVIHVSWDDAKAYAAWISKMTGKTYRLLTEAEWEYAARGCSNACPSTTFCLATCLATPDAPSHSRSFPSAPHPDRTCCASKLRFVQRTLGTTFTRSESVSNCRSVPARGG